MEEETKVEVKIERKSDKNKLFAWMEEHPKAVFATRLVLWIIFAAALPFAFIAWRYGIFTSESQLKLTGWGFIGIVIVIVFLVSLVRYIYKGLKPGFIKQCIAGVVSIIIPLIILYLLINAIEDSVHIFKQALGCTIICELVGIPLNPFPEWIAKRQEELGKEKVETMSDIVWDKFFSRKKKEDGGE